MQKQKFLRIVILFLSFVGFLILSYLTYIKYSKSISFCDISAQFSCDTVTTSAFSTFFGIPLSVLGSFFFIFIFCFTLFCKQDEKYKYAAYATVLMLVPSYFLTGVEIFVIGSICILCETSKILMLLIFASVLFLAKPAKQEVLKIYVPLLFVGVLFAFGMYSIQARNHVVIDNSQFVQRLNDAGVVYIVTNTCVDCKTQNKIFGKAVKNLKTINCDVKKSCESFDLNLKDSVNRFPKFVIIKDGKVLKTLEGVQNLDIISLWSSVPL